MIQLLLTLGLIVIILGPAILASFVDLDAEIPE